MHFSLLIIELDQTRYS